MIDAGEILAQDFPKNNVASILMFLDLSELLHHRVEQLEKKRQGD